MIMVSCIVVLSAVLSINVVRCLLLEGGSWSCFACRAAGAELLRYFSNFAAKSSNSATPHMSIISLKLSKVG